MNLNIYSRPLDALLPLLTREDIDLSPSYQRESVWSIDRQRNLIRSLLLGLPIGALFLNRRSYSEGQRCVDGKQRIEAIRAWVNGTLQVPGDWFDPAKALKESSLGKEMVSFSDLTEIGQRRFTMSTVVATYESMLPTEEAERELYLLINFGGVPHDATEHQQLTRA